CPAAARIFYRCWATHRCLLSPVWVNGSCLATGSPADLWLSELKTLSAAFVATFVGLGIFRLRLRQSLRQRCKTSTFATGSSWPDSGLRTQEAIRRSMPCIIQVILTEDDPRQMGTVNGQGANAGRASCL